MRPWTLFLLIGAAALFPLGNSVAADADSAARAKIQLDETTFNPAAKCGECHIDIHAMWRESLHSQAMTDPTFLAAFNDPRVQESDKNRAHCLRCHAPGLQYDKQLTLDSPVAQEGITCDFCHSVQEMSPADPAKPFVVTPGRLKRGPFKDSQSPVHETRQADHFENGALCGGCHEMRNVLNTPIITTYSEWREGYYEKKGSSTCPDCHMPMSPGVTVSSDLRKTKRRINLHSFPGGHSRVQLHDALVARVMEETRSYGKMKVKIGVTNSGAGHAIPTGNPLRRLEVEFRAYGTLDRLLHEEKVELAKHFADKFGKPVTTDVGVLLDARKVLRDDRIAPGETRELVFEFMAPDEKILVEARVWYVYENAQAPDQSRRESLAILSKVVNKRSVN